MRPTLESLLAGEMRPDRILIPLPPSSIREQCAYTVPDFLKDSDFCGEVIKVIPADRDWGPGTKSLGALSALPAEGYLVVADDDVRYHKHFLKGLIDAQQADHSASFSYYTYRVRGLTVGQGCDGFSFWLPNLQGLQAFAERHVVDSNLLFHDDLWVSFFLTSRDVQIRRAAAPEGGGLIYAIEHHVNPLNRLSGDLSRRAINLSSMRRLLREVPMPWQTRQRIRLISALDRLWTNPVRKLRRHLNKV